MTLSKSDVKSGFWQLLRNLKVFRDFEQYI